MVDSEDQAVELLTGHAAPRPYGKTHRRVGEASNPGPAGIDELTADLVPDKPSNPRRRTRAAAAAEEEDDPELMAAAMREALEEMAGEQDGTSAEMLQLIRENLEEALTGEYAGELREALRKAGVDDALGVFEDFVEENLGDLIEDDDESEEKL